MCMYIHIYIYTVHVYNIIYIMCFMYSHYTVHQNTVNPSTLAQNPSCYLACNLPTVHLCPNLRGLQSTK